MKTKIKEGGDAQRARKRAAKLDIDVISDTDIEKAFVDEDTAFRIHQILHKLVIGLL